MGKSTQLFTPEAASAMNAILSGNAFFIGLALKCKTPEESVSRNLKKLNRWKQVIEQHGFNPTRQVEAIQLYEKEMKGRTLESVKLGLETELDRNMGKAKDKAEQAIAKKWYGLRVTLQYDCLKFYHDLFADQKVKVETVKAKQAVVA